MRRLLLPLLAALLAAPSLGAAWAQTPVELRAHPVSTGARVTLGDLFDGVDGPAAATIVARAAPVGLDAVLDAGEVQLLARRAGLLWPNAAGYHRIAVSSQGVAAAAPAAPIQGRRRTTPGLVWSRDLAAGAIITVSDLRWSAEGQASADPLLDPELVVGKAARRPLREGEAASASELLSPILVRRDDPVNVVFEADGVSLTLQGKALGDAQRGQVVEVVNLQSKKVIEAVCSGPGAAAVGPKAEALKAAATLDPTRIASLR